jgi:uncharacterized OB-fold protein
MTPSPSPRVMRDDVMQLDPPQLLGTHCAACGAVTFPRREFCAACGERDGLATRGLSSAGTVHCFTVVRQAPPGRAVPYVLAYVDLPRDQVRVLAQLDVAPERARIGLAVKTEFRTVRIDDGHPVVGYVFVPAEEGGL